MENKDAIKIIIGIYLLVSVITFGHAFNGSESACTTPDGNKMEACQVAGGLIAGTVWPLYASVHIWN